MKKENRPVGRIEYLGRSGRVGETIEFYDEKTFVHEVLEEAYYGAPITAVLYRDEQGNTIDQNFLLRIDTLSVGVRIE